MSFNNEICRENMLITTENLIMFKYYFFLQEVLENILDLDISVKGSTDFLEFISGGKVIFGSVPLAHRYGGHQVSMALILSGGIMSVFSCELHLDSTCKYTSKCLRVHEHLLTF